MAKTSNPLLSSLPVSTLRAACAAGLIGLSASAARAAETPAKVGLEELIQLILDQDPELEVLRTELQVSKAAAREIRWWEDPELRVSYTRNSDEAVPAPYTETLSQTRTERGSSSARTSGTRSSSASENRDIQEDFRLPESERRTSSSRESFRENDNRSINRSSTETTTREVTPMRDRVVVRETTRIAENGSESRSTTGTSSSQGSENRAVSTVFGDVNTAIGTSGSARESQRQSTRTSERITREDVQERIYGQDPYAGSDEYNFQLRLYPLNPWEVRAETRKALAEASLAEFMVGAAERERAWEVREAFREAQFKRREIAVLEARAALLKADLAYLDEIAASGVRDDREAKVRSAYFDTTLELENLRNLEEYELGELAVQAGLEDSARIDLTHPATPPLVDRKALDVQALMAVAMDHNPDQGRALLESRIHAAELSVKQAARIPWLSVITAEYGFEERDGDKVQDAYTVLAGVQIPLFTWMDGNLGAGEKAALASLQRQRELAERRVGLRLRKALRDVESGAALLERFRSSAPTVEKRIRDELARVPEFDPSTRKIRVELEKALIDIQEHTIKNERAYALALLSLESALGTGIQQVFAARPAGAPAPAAP